MHREHAVLPGGEARRIGQQLEDADGWESESRRLYTHCGIRPTLGELPETRWIEAAVAPALATD